MSDNFALRIRHVISYTWLMGGRWLVFRIIYAFKKKIGYFSFKNRQLLSKVRHTNWASLINQIKLEQLNITDPVFKGESSFIEKADQALSGNIFSFSSVFLDYSETNGHIAWNINPESRKKAPLDKPWNKLPDFGDYGDIKLIWEASRFPQVFYFINAYSLTQDDRYAHGCIRQMADWCLQNPFPQGPHYKCGQEIAFRLFSWVIALDYFKEFVSKESKTIILLNIYISLLRIDINIDFAAKSIRNNHSISESAGLVIGSILFPQFPESERLFKKGLSYLETELGYQVYKDGSYIQHSMNYQRLVVDILSFAIFLCRKKQVRLPDAIIQAHHQMVAFLLSFIQENGWLPNYGTNDGANLFPVSSANYRDFRPSLNFALGLFQEPFNIGGSLGICHLFGIKQGRRLQNKYQNEFRDGGYYILRDTDSFGFIRSHSYKDRPGQCDMLHLDIWHNGHNLFCDSGSFSYHSTRDKAKGFEGMAGHNTIMINDADPMKKTGHFGWSPWIKARVLDFSNNKITAAHYGYQTSYGVVHQRTVQLVSNGFVIIDQIMGDFDPIKIQQIWNTLDKVIPIDACSFRVQNSRIQSNMEGHVDSAYISSSYHQYSQGQKIIFETVQDQPFKIETIIRFDEL